MVLKLFLIFLSLGFFSFGGGYTFLTLMKTELVEKYALINQSDLILSITAGQITPGPVAVAGSFAGFLIGYRTFGNLWGGFGIALLAWLAVTIPSIVGMGIIMRAYNWVAKHPVVPFIFRFIMPVVIGLIFYLGVSTGLTGISTLAQFLIAVVSFILAWSGKIDYAFIIIGGGLIGYFFL